MKNMLVKFRKFGYKGEEECTQKIRVEEIMALATKALKNYGLDNNDTSIVVGHLFEQELMGKSSHGFYRLLGIIRIIKNNEVSKNEISFLTYLT